MEKWLCEGGEGKGRRGGCVREGRGRRRGGCVREGRGWRSGCVREERGMGEVVV